MAGKRTTNKREKPVQDVRELGANTVGVASGILFSKIMTIIVGGIALIFVARLLGSSAYGIYGLATSVVGILTSIGGLGISTALPKFIAEYKSKRQKAKLDSAVASGLAAVIISGLVLTFITILLSTFISQLVFKTAAFWYLIIIASFIVTLAMLLDASYSALVGLGRKGMLVKVTLLQITSQAVVSISLALLGFGPLAPVLGVIVGFCAGDALALWSIYTCGEIGFRLPDSKSMKSILAFALPVGIYLAVSGIVSNLANVILGLASNTAIVGSFVFASKIGGVMTVAVDSVGVALLPLLASMQGKKQSIYTEKFYNYAIYLMLVLLMPVVFSVALLSRNIALLVGGSFIAAAYYIPVVAVGAIITMLSYYTSIMLLSRNKVIEVLKYSALSSLIELVLVVLLVPTFKGLGLAFIVFIITPLISFLAYHRQVGKMLQLKLPYGKIARAFVAALASAAVIFPIIFLFHGSSIITIVLSFVTLLIIYPPIISLFGGIVKSDLVTIKDISGGIPVVGQVLSVLSSYAMHYAR